MEKQLMLTPTTACDELRTFADAILADDYHPGQLRQTLHDFENWLLALTDLRLESEDNRKNLDAKQGMALGPTWAAMCVEDILRTRCFVRGLNQAILHKLAANPARSVHVLYAGCGPFATLILPLLTRFTSAQLRVTLIEINPISADCVEKLFARLGLQDYVVDFLRVDAVQVKLAQPSDIDIVVSETMQRALKNECQVQIMSNLMAQLSDEVIMVPQRITLTLASQDYSTAKNSADDVRPYQSLGTLFDFSVQTIRGGAARIENGSLTLQTNDVTAQLPHHDVVLYVLTEIQVFADECLTLNQSGLTTPERIRLPLNLARTEANFADAKPHALTCAVQYVIDPKPRIATTFSRV
jgi:predicted RNA methylase